MIPIFVSAQDTLDFSLLQFKVHTALYVSRNPSTKSNIFHRVLRKLFRIKIVETKNEVTLEPYTVQSM